MGGEKGAADPNTMSVASMRAELLELLEALFPEKPWPRRVPAAELAAFALQELPTGLFLALSGEGWVAGGDGIPQALAAGEAAFISRGEVHSKGSETGLTALMVQVRDLDPLSSGFPE